MRPATDSSGSAGVIATRRQYDVAFEQKYAGVVCIRNNVFVEQSGGHAVQNGGDISSTGVVLEYNSFLSTDRVAVKLHWYGSDAKLDATNNYWNTTDVNTIAETVFDKHDDPGHSGYVPFEPFLEAPHPDTPTCPF